MTRYIKPFSKGELSAARSNGGSPIRPFPEAAAVTGTEGQTGGGADAWNYHFFEEVKEKSNFAVFEGRISIYIHLSLSLGHESAESMYVSLHLPTYARYVTYASSLSLDYLSYVAPESHQEEKVMIIYSISGMLLLLTRPYVD